MAIPIIAPKGTINQIKTMQALGLHHMEIKFNDEFARGETQLKDSEVIDQHAISGFVIDFLSWNYSYITLQIFPADKTSVADRSVGWTKTKGFNNPF